MDLAINVAVPPPSLVQEPGNQRMTDSDSESVYTWGNEVPKGYNNTVYILLMGCRNNLVGLNLAL